MFRSPPVRPLFVAASLAAVLASAACSSDSGGSSDGQAPASTSPAGTSQVTTPASTPEAPAGSALVLGPIGIGALKLGMTEDQIAATGQVGKVNYLSDTEECGSASSHDPVGAYSLWVSRTKGLVAVVAIGPDPHTPEGIGKGATLAAVRKAYPAMKPVGATTGGQFQAAIPTNAAAFYQFDLIGGTTSQVILALKTQTCFG
jgi:hypothetical protein